MPQYDERVGITGRRMIGGMPLSSDNPGWSRRERRVILLLLGVAALMPVLVVLLLRWFR